MNEVTRSDRCDSLPSPPITDPAPPDFLARKQALRERLQRSLPESRAVLDAAEQLAAFQQDGSFLTDGPLEPPAPGQSSAQAHEAAFARWARRSFALGAEQTQKYLRVARTFTRADVVGKTLGIESLNQIALADPRLRPTLWTLAQDERLSSGALAEGRQSGRRVLRGERGDERGDLDAAVAATILAAQRRARRQERAGSSGTRGGRAASLGRLEQALGRVTAQIEALLQAEAAPADAAAQARVQGQLQALPALCDRLNRRLAASAGGAPDETAAAPAIAPPLTAAPASRDGAPLQPAQPPLVDDAEPPPLPLVSAAAAALVVAPGDALTALAAAGARHQPVVRWLQELPAPRRDLLVALLTGVLLGACPMISVKVLLDRRVPAWDVDEPPAPHFKRWRDALTSEEGRAVTALRTLAAVDPTQLLLILPRLLDLLEDPEQIKKLALQEVEPELRTLASRYGAAVVCLRHQDEREREEESARK